MQKRPEAKEKRRKPRRRKQQFTLRFLVPHGEIPPIRHESPLRVTVRSILTQIADNWKGEGGTLRISVAADLIGEDISGPEFDRIAHDLQRIPSLVNQDPTPHKICDWKLPEIGSLVITGFFVATPPTTDRAGKTVLAATGENEHSPLDSREGGLAQGGSLQLPEENVKRLVEAIPSSAYDTLSAKMESVGHAFRSAVAQALQPGFNEKARTFPQQSYEEKKDLAKWINGELRKFGLALQCPKTGRASILLADPGRFPEQGRFQFDNVDDEGSAVRSLSSNALPELVLVPDDLRRTHWGRWADRSGQKSSGRKI